MATQPHIKLFLEINPQGTVAIALNKADLVPPEKLAKLVELYSSYEQTQVLGTHLTSAKTGIKVKDIFSELAHKLI